MICILLLISNIYITFPFYICNSQMYFIYIHVILSKSTYFPHKLHQVYFHISKAVYVIINSILSRTFSYTTATPPSITTCSHTDPTTTSQPPTTEDTTTDDESIHTPSTSPTILGHHNPTHIHIHTHTPPPPHTRTHKNIIKDKEGG